MTPRLGELELFVLLAAARLGDEAYAVSIAREIVRQTGRKAGRASVYVTLQRLEQKGLVSTRLGEPVAERGGKARRLVQLTAAGQDAARDSRTALTRLWHGLEFDEEGHT